MEDGKGLKSKAEVGGLPWVEVLMGVINSSDCIPLTLGAEKADYRHRQ